MNGRTDTFNGDLFALPSDIYVFFFINTSAWWLFDLIKELVLDHGVSCHPETLHFHDPRTISLVSIHAVVLHMPLRLALKYTIPITVRDRWPFTYDVMQFLPFFYSPLMVSWGHGSMVLNQPFGQPGYLTVNSYIILPQPVFF